MRKIQILGIVALSLVLSACLTVQVKKGVDDPSPYFEKAYRQIERIHQEFPSREGWARRIHVLVYDGSSGELIKATAALWLVNGCLDLGTKAAEWSGDFEGDFEFDWRAIKDLGQVGPGLLIEVEDERDRVLIWQE